MKKHLLKKIFPLLTYLGLIIFPAVLSFAAEHQTTEPKQTLAQFFEEEVLSTDKALQMESTSITMIGDHSDNDAYFFRRFWLRLRPRVERDIPWLAGFSVIPELEMLFEKPAPEGWEMYKAVK